MPDYRKLLHKQQIPKYFWEKGIVGGYRPPGITIRQSLLSIFSIHNETCNVWTHLIALILNFWCIQQVCSDLSHLSNEYKAPLLCFMVTSCIYPIGSIFAHTFNSMSEFTRHCSFMVDYFGISVYAFGTALANLAYAFPPSWRNNLSENSFIIVNFIGATLSVSLSCRSRFGDFDIYTKLWRAFSFILPYATSMTVLLFRVMFTSYSEYDAPYNYCNHFLCAFGVIVFYMGHIPETLFPGRFDIYFHSHQIFHVLVSAGTYHKLLGLQKDIDSQYSMVVIPRCIQWMTLLTVVNTVITGYYIYQKYQQVYSSERKKDLRKGGDGIGKGGHHDHCN